MKLEFSIQTTKKKIAVKLTYLLLLSLLFSNLLLAQDQQHVFSEEAPRQVGLNVTAFVKNFITPNEQPTVPDQGVDFWFRKMRSPGKNSRFGVGLGFTQTSFDSNKFNSLTLQLRGGQEFYRDFARRWRAYIGWDTGILFNRSVTDFDLGEEFIATDFTTGFGMVLGVQWAINKHLSLSTEAQYSLFGTFSKQDEDSATTFGLMMQQPVSLQLNYHY